MALHIYIYFFFLEHCPFFHFLAIFHIQHAKHYLTCINEDSDQFTVYSGTYCHLQKCRSTGAHGRYHNRWFQIRGISRLIFFLISL